MDEEKLVEIIKEATLETLGDNLHEAPIDDETFAVSLGLVRAQDNLNWLINDIKTGALGRGDVSNRATLMTALDRIIEELENAKWEATQAFRKNVTALLTEDLKEARMP